MTAILGVFALLVLLAVAAWWLLIYTEGVYLGRRVVVWLYDIYASRYDGIKEFNESHEHILLADPIMAAIAPQTAPVVLDVGTGTGRLPIALLQHDRFEGQVVGVDLSWRMLAQAQHKFDDLGDDWTQSVSLMQQTADKLAFPDACFDVVTCLEALEFTPDMRASLDEMIRVLRPGGLLLLTNRINARIPGRVWSRERMQAELEQRGIQRVHFEVWQYDYDKVWGVKGV